MKAKIIANKNFKIGEIDNRIYGSFIEHLGRAVYDGIYEPCHKTANKDGFREDVIGVVKELDVPIIRYPGGCFASGYDWEDGIGDKANRPKRMELSWKSIEPNLVGIDEFQEWTKQVNSQVMMAVNLGTKGPQEAVNLVEYCNGTADSEYANRRRANGYENPYNIKTWCLGNEMDGHWSIGYKTPYEYGRIANETAKLMKWADPSIELVLCGSSSYDMPSFGEWEMVSLEQTYENVDYISLHQYYGNFSDNTADFLGRSIHMNDFIKSVSAICDAIKAKKKSKKKINLSFDEWNVWYRTKFSQYENWKTGLPMLEEVYSFEDALVLGCMMMTIQNNCDRVKIACLAQLVNVIAPIMTKKDGGIWLQTIYYPFAFASKYGRGEVLQTVKDCDSYATSDGLEVPYIESCLILNEQEKEITLFAVNRSLGEDVELEMCFENFENPQILEHILLYSDNLKVTNEEKENIKPINIETDMDNKKINLKKHSWNMIRFKY